MKQRFSRAVVRLRRILVRIVQPGFAAALTVVMTLHTLQAFAPAWSAGIVKAGPWRHFVRRWDMFTMPQPLLLEPWVELKDGRTMRLVDLPHPSSWGWESVRLIILFNHSSDPAFLQFACDLYADVQRWDVRRWQQAGSGPDLHYIAGEPFRYDCQTPLPRESS